MPNRYNPHHNFSATVKTSKDAPRNPLAFNRSKQLRNFAPEAIELPFELELENIQKGSEQLNSSGLLIVQGISYLTAKQTLSLTYSNDAVLPQGFPQKNYPEGTDRKQSKFAVFAGIAGHFESADYSEDIQATLSTITDWGDSGVFTMRPVQAQNNYY
jgi:hypothetical protein